MSIPFNEYEKRFLLAEIIKASNVPTETLLKIVKDEQIEPNWSEIFVPHARNVKACSEAFQELLSSPSDALRPATSFEPFPPAPKKRRHSATEHAASNTRTLQPKPASSGEPDAVFRSTSGTFPKKRGRPSKGEIAKRQAEAAARGEVYPPAKTPGRKSLGVSQFPATMVAGGSTPQPGPKTGGGNMDSSKKKRGRPSKEASRSKKPFDLSGNISNTGETPHPAMDEDVVQHLNEQTHMSDADPLGEETSDNNAIQTLLQQYSNAG